MLADVLVSFTFGSFMPLCCTVQHWTLFCGSRALLMQYSRPVVLMLLCLCCIPLHRQSTISKLIQILAKYKWTLWVVSAWVCWKLKMDQWQATFSIIKYFCSTINVLHHWPRQVLMLHMLWERLNCQQSNYMKWCHQKRNTVLCHYMRRLCWPCSPDSWRSKLSSQLKANMQTFHGNMATPAMADTVLASLEHKRPQKSSLSWAELG